MSKQVPTIKVLVRARELVADENTWTHFACARDAAGSPTYTASTTACKWCASGAIRKATVDQGLEWADADPLLGALSILSERLTSEGDFIKVNDYLGRAAALRVMDAAIAELTGVAA